MAIYELACGACNHTFEVLCHTSERDLQRSCPKCGYPKTVRKNVSTFGMTRGTTTSNQAGAIAEAGAGISIQGLEHVSAKAQIIGCEIYDCIGAGVSAKDSHTNISNTRISDCGTGIEAINSRVTAKRTKIE